MKNLDRIRKSIRLRMPFMSEPAPVLDAHSNSNAFEALLYLRRASELLHASTSVERIRGRIDLAICELQEALASARQRQASSLDGTRGADEQPRRHAERRSDINAGRVGA